MTFRYDRAFAEDGYLSFFDQPKFPDTTLTSKILRECTLLEFAGRHQPRRLAAFSEQFIELWLAGY
jgi:hypothetical protein